MKPTCLITGASRGIGYELARQFAEHGYNLILVSRNLKQLKTVKKELEAEFQVKCLVKASDLGKERERLKLIRWCSARKAKVDVLINNAGFGFFQDFSKSKWELERDMIEVNITALTHLCKLFLPQMKNRKSGKIMNVASTASFQPGPHSAVYYASKAYVLSFSEAIAEELRGTGIQVTALCPGPTRTDFGSEVGGKGLFLKTSYGMEASQVAEIGYRKLMKGQEVIITGWRNWVFAQLNRLAPRRLSSKVSGKLIQ